MKKYLSNFDLKLIAIITMTIDHVGFIFNPPFYDLFRIVGRLSFPIFAFLLTEGYLHTSNIKRYLLRLFVFALISEIIYDYFMYNKIFYFNANNIFFTLFLGLLTILCLDKSKNLIKNYFKEKIDLFIVLPITYTLIIIIFSLISLIFNLNYGILGILLISFFYLFKNNYLLLVMSCVLSTFLFSDYMQYYCLFSLVLIYFYNNKLGRKTGLFFYLYYPLHILVLGIIKILLG